MTVVPSRDQRTYRGPRPDAEPSDQLPTYRLSDPSTVLPTTCPRGRGHLIEHDLPIGTRVGMITCVTDGRTMGWIVS